jgi:hypothetical protein
MLDEHGWVEAIDQTAEIAHGTDEVVSNGAKLRHPSGAVGG